MVDSEDRASYIQALDFLACVDVDGVALHSMASDAVPLLRERKRQLDLTETGTSLLIDAERVSH
jgi:hypothetical protein